MAYLARAAVNSLALEDNELVLVGLQEGFKLLRRVDLKFEGNVRVGFDQSEKTFYAYEGVLLLSEETRRGLTRRIRESCSVAEDPAEGAAVSATAMVLTAARRGVTSLYARMEGLAAVTETLCLVA